MKYFFKYSAWLSGYESPVISRINTRIQDLTGLDVSTAEELQVDYKKKKKKKNFADWPHWPLFEFCVLEDSRYPIWEGYIYRVLVIPGVNTASLNVAERLEQNSKEYQGFDISAELLG